jgi:hypothetical protein
MRKHNALSITVPFAGSTVQLWTVVYMVDDRIFSSIHTSEYEAYCEAVSLFKSIEVGAPQQVSVLRDLLKLASRCADYQEVRKYIQDHACRIQSIQLAEHSINDFNRNGITIPQAATNFHLPSRAFA